MRCHDTKCEKKVGFFPSIEQDPHFLRKNCFFFITEEKTGFLEKDLQICGFLMR